MTGGGSNPPRYRHTVQLKSGALQDKHSICTPFSLLHGGKGRYRRGIIHSRPKKWRLHQKTVLLSLRALRRAGRVVEGARLESVYTETYRGFESLALRQLHLYSFENKPFFRGLFL